MRTLGVAGCAGILVAGGILAQSGGAASAFGAAEIRPSSPNTILEMRSAFAHGRYILKNATLVDLIRTAWDVDADKVAGGPEWLDTRRFDMTATAPASASPEALRLMLRRLLGDRFGLVVREENRSVPAYAITAGKKPQLRPAATAGSGCRMAAPGVFECGNTTMAAFAKALAGAREASGYLLGYPVVDRTGIGGAWDFKLEWSPRTAGRASAGADAVTLFEALEKQLGLRLELRKVSTPVIVVDRVSEVPKAETGGGAENPPVFEVADIKPGDPNIPCGTVSVRPGGRVQVSMTLKGLISEAWGDMNPERIVLGPRSDVPKSGVPKSLNTTCFVVVAKAPVDEDSAAGANAAGWNGPVWHGVDIDSMRMMLRALLAERFGLAAHEEDRPISGYELAAARPKLRKADASNRPGCREGPGADGKDPRLTNPVVSRLVTCRNMTLAQFAAQLNNLFVELPPVADATGIAGRYDMTISFSPQALLLSAGPPGAAGETAPSEPNGAISFSEALRRQLGLRLQSRRVMAPVLVVDHLNETPTEN